MNLGVIDMEELFSPTMKTKAILFALLLFVSAIPSAAGAGYNGIQLGRPAVTDFTLTDQTGNNFSFHNMTGDAIVVSFIFTRCPDVCPVITQKLKSVQDGLDDSLKVNFISISVDPHYDTPEKLTTYMATHNVEWPHLTGELTVIEPVWDSFIIQTEQQTIPVEEEHDQHDDMDGMEGMDDMNMTIDMGVIIVNESGVANDYEVQPTGYHLLKAAAYEANWSFNTSINHVATGLNGVNAPSDSSWMWEVHAWDENSSAWRNITADLDDIDAFNDSILAFAPNNTADSEIPVPVNGDASITLVYPNGSNDSIALPDMNGWHMTASALDSAGVNFSAPDSSSGHFLVSVEDEPSANSSWWWQLHVWDMGNNTWMDSDFGMDSLIEQNYIAWAPNSTNNTDIPAPGFASVDLDKCNGKGWVMGSEQNAHCMCDAGYEWAEDDMMSCVTVPPHMPEYTVGHSTMTYILDADFKPLVAWSGSDWNVADMVADIHMVATGSALVDTAIDSDDSWLPGFTFGIIASALGLAIIATRREY
jgi:cytochrome oxidase Cu insertion factor (SCO1/SenC/PrrC family)